MVNLRGQVRAAKTKAGQAEIARAAAIPDTEIGLFTPTVARDARARRESTVMTSESALQQARYRLRDARAIAVLTGAGISAESGVPTFRGPQGLWREFRPEELATPEAFARDPRLVWEWYDWRRGILSKVKPNAGQEALAKLELRLPRFTLITQNVDGLHQLAGSKAVLELHGNIWRIRCTKCNREWEDRTVPVGFPVRCECGAQARPAVVWFGESLPANVLQQAEKAAQRCDVFLVVGTSAVVYPAAGLAPLARAAGASIIEVNIESTPVSDLADQSLRGPAAEILREICG